MRPSSKSTWVRLNFRVNELEFEEALLRPCGEDPADFQLVVEHRFLGSFALHENFFLERRQSNPMAGWHQVSLQELKLAFLEASRNDGCVTEKERDCWDVSGMDLGGNDGSIPRMPVEGDSSHIDRAKEALSCGGVWHQIVGGIGSHGYIWGHATFQVCSLSRAAIQLRNAGFLQSSNSQCVLVDSKNGWSIRLIEGAPRTDRRN